MSRTWTDDCFSGSHQGQVDLQAFEDNFAALKSCFSGPGGASDPVPGMQCYDTTKKVTKRRDYANAAWHGVMHADGSQKIWIYRNAALEGWVIDSSITDCVLALKGGTLAYNVNGGNQAGTWQTVGHVLTQAELPNISTNNSAATDVALQSYHGTGPNQENTCSFIGFEETAVKESPPSWTSNINYFKVTVPAHNHSLGGSGTAHEHGATQRVAAAVGTLQYMDL